MGVSARVPLDKREGEREDREETGEEVILSVEAVKEEEEKGREDDG
jgi:hypothetical protein